MATLTLIFETTTTPGLGLGWGSGGWRWSHGDPRPYLRHNCHTCATHRMHKLRAMIHRPWTNAIQSHATWAAPLAYGIRPPTPPPHTLCQTTTGNASSASVRGTKKAEVPDCNQHCNHDEDTSEAVHQHLRAWPRRQHGCKGTRRIEKVEDRPLPPSSLHPTLALAPGPGPGSGPGTGPGPPPCTQP